MPNNASWLYLSRNNSKNAKSEINDNKVYLEDMISKIRSSSKVIKEEKTKRAS